MLSISCWHMVIYLISKEGYLSISSILTVPHPTVPSLSPVCTGKSTFSLAGRRQTSSAKVNFWLLFPRNCKPGQRLFFHQIKPCHIKSTLLCPLLPHCYPPLQSWSTNKASLSRPSARSFPWGLFHISSGHIWSFLPFKDSLIFRFFAPSPPL